MKGFFYKRLKKLYEKLDSIIIPSDENICGDCLKCCTAAARQKVSAIEKSYIEKFLNDNNLSLELMECYDSFLFLRAGDTGGYESICPFYSNERNMCLIYSVRPYSCRIYGSYGKSIKELPVNCIYRKYMKSYINIKEIPFCEEYAGIATSYNIYMKYVGGIRRIFSPLKNK